MILMENIELFRMLGIPNEVERQLIDYGNSRKEQIPNAVINKILNPDEWSGGIKELQELLGDDPNGFKILWELLNIIKNYSYEEYVKRNIPNDIFIATMKFCTRFLNEHYHTYHFYKFVWAWWFPRQISLNEYRIGGNFMRRICAKSIAFALSAVMFTASAAPIHAEAAKKIMPKLSKTKVTMTAGNKKKITVKNAKAAKVKSVKWTVNKKGKKVIKLTGKTKKQVTIRALKKGSAVVTVKIKTKKKTVTKKIKVTVKKKSSTSTANQTKQPTAASTPSRKPAQTPTPAPKPSVTKMPTETAEPTKAPAIYGEPGKAAAYDKEKTNYSLKIDSSKKVHEISDMLFGAFIEDINFAADGGLYAEMVQNRSFEFKIGRAHV